MAKTTKHDIGEYVRRDITIEDTAAYVTVFRRPGEAVQADFNFFEGNRDIEWVRKVYSALADVLHVMNEIEAADRKAKRGVGKSRRGHR